ncbi:MAG: RHS repeat-associated core domain-containing protein, partial [Bacteroidota bacterium]
FRVNTYEYTFSPRPFIGYWIQLSSKREQQYLEDRLITYNYSYDLSGNLTTESKDFNGDYTQTVTTAYGQFGGPAPNRPTSITVLSQRPGQVSHSITSKLRYNNVGQVTQVQKYAGLPQQVTTDYTYHPLGNQKTETISAAGVLSRTTIKNYDSKGRFVTEIINPLGQSSTATYDIKWGKPISTTGIHGLTNTYAYDAFGRLIRNNRPEGYQTQESYGWDINQQLGTTHYYRQTFPGRPDVITYFDKLGRKRMVKTEGFQNQWITQSWTYDSRGRKKTERAPYMQGETTFTTTFNYDIYNRLINSSNPFGTTSYAYYYTNGILTTTVTNPDGETATAKTDAINLVIEAGDQGGTLHYTYNSQKLQTQTALGSTVALTTIYDVYGRKIQMTDKNAGTTTYAYNPFDEQTSHINARGDTYNMSYDRLGRMLRRTGPDEDRFFSYHGAGIPEANKVRYAYNSITYGGDAEYYFYDGFGRLDHLTTRIDGIDHQTYFEHNAYGDVIKKIFPSGFDLDYTYDANGYLLAINHQTTKGPINLFINQGMNGRNQCTSYYLGNNKTSTKSYNHGVPTRYHTQGIQDLQMSWDYSNGNLTNRFDVLKGLSESFNYDNLQRLTGSEVTGHPAQTTSYLPNGNINSKTDVGSYSYPPTTDNAVISVANSSGTIPTVTQDITYTGFDQPETLREGNYELTYDYGSNHERIKSTLRQNGSEVASRYYIGEYEKQVKNGVTQHLHYVNAGEGTIAIVESVNNVEKIYYTYTDHLGSILTVTDENAVVVAEQNFDAWGRKRNASNWTYAGVASVPDWLYRGYTAHEHMPEFQLINMNGRLYDPVLGRMLSPDNYIQDVANTQSYNRYAYVFNNPLKYTDPTGEAAVVKVIAVALYIGYATYTGGKFANNGEKDPREWDFSSSRTWKFLIIGAAIGYATGGLGAAVGIAGGAAGIKFSGLLSVMVSSLTNSMGLHILTGGYTPVYIHFGVASYDLTNNEVGYFGKKGNTLYENIGYAVGALKLYSDMKGSLGYGGKEMTSAAGGESLSELRPYTDPGGVSSGAPSKVITGGGHSPAHVTDPTQGMLYDINSGIDKTKLTNYGTHTKPNAPKPGAYSNLAVSHTNSVLMQTGQFNAAIQPYLLHAQAALRVFGFQAYLYSVQRLGND